MSSGEKAPPVDFVIIGAMKAGTTTLHSWLASQLEIGVATSKEPAFFSRDDRFGKGLGWYRELFPAREGRLLGEASTGYTNPRFASQAARRMSSMIPEARLIYLIRHPIERARSHYRHQVQRGRESRPLVEALADPSTLYLEQSKYWSAVAPYVELFAADQLLVVRLDDLEDEGWKAVLRHLALSYRDPPGRTENVTADKAQFGPTLSRLYSPRLQQLYRLAPKGVRGIGRRVLVRSGPRYRALMDGSRDPIPASLTDPLWEDLRSLETWLGGRRLWDLS